MEWKNVIGTLAPTIASALAGPAAGVVVSQLGEILGFSGAKQTDIQQAIEQGKLTSEQIAAIKELELKLQAEEQERGFRYTELEFKDRDSARRASVEGGTSQFLFYMTCILLPLSIGAEIYILINGLPSNTSDLVAGRVLGLLDAITMMVISFWFGSSHGSVKKTEMLADKK